MEEVGRLGISRMLTEVILCAEVSAEIEHEVCKSPHQKEELSFVEALRATPEG